MITIRLNTIKIDSIDSFFAYHGNCNGSVRDTLFVKALGTNEYLPEKLTAIEKRVQSDGRLWYRRIDSLPKSITPDDSRFYTNALNNYGLKNCPADREFIPALRNAVKQAVDIYNMGANITPSMVNNFTVKLLWQTDTVIGAALKGWSANINAKIIGADVRKKSDLLFFYMLSLLGYDVLILCPAQDIQVDGLDSLLVHSFELGRYGTLTLPPFREQTTFPTVPMPEPVPARSNIKIKIPDNPTRSNVKVKIPENPAHRRTQPVQPSAPQKPASQPVTVPPPVRPLPRNTAPVYQAPVQRREKNSEELAALAASVVMICCIKGDEITGNGSGIMIGRNGFILTNCHVIRGENAFAVRLENDDKVYFTTEVIKYDTVHDLAVIRIDRKLTPIPIYDQPVPLRRGQRVVAIGSPMGMFNSVSDGIISGFRNTKNMEMIQFTAPTSPGSSGGALLNVFGEVIGISTAGVDEGQNLNLAVGYKDILPFVRGFTN